MKDKNVILTAWMFCRECDKLDDGTGKRPCSGKAFDFVVKDDVEFMKNCNYNFDGTKLLEN
jgi:hypothetical protein